MTKLFSDDILNSQALKRRKSWLVPAHGGVIIEDYKPTNGCVKALSESVP